MKKLYITALALAGVLAGGEVYGQTAPEAEEIIGQANKIYEKQRGLPLRDSSVSCDDSFGMATYELCTSAKSKSRTCAEMANCDCRQRSVRQILHDTITCLNQPVSQRPVVWGTNCNAEFTHYLYDGGLSGSAAYNKGGSTAKVVAIDRNCSDISWGFYSLPSYDRRGRYLRNNYDILAHDYSRGGDLAKVDPTASCPYLQSDTLKNFADSCARRLIEIE